MRPQDGNVDGENTGKMMINHGVECFFPPIFRSQISFWLPWRWETNERGEQCGHGDSPHSTVGLYLDGRGTQKF